MRVKWLINLWFRKVMLIILQNYDREKTYKKEKWWITAWTSTCSRKSLKSKSDPWILSPLNSDSRDIQLVTWLVVSLGNTALKKGYEPWHSNKSLQPEAETSICKSVNSLICLDNKTGIIHKAVIWSGHFRTAEGH